MRTLGRVSAFVGRWFAVIVVLAGLIAFWQPTLFAGWVPAIPWLLGVIMLGMGMTIQPKDFAIVARRPVPVLLGVAAQYVVMPLVALGLAEAFGMSGALAVGMVLVGAAPGGTASNVMVYLAKGDTALSVAMTTISTLLAPLLTPVLILVLAGQYLPIDAGGLFLSIVQIVVVPILLGLLLRRFLSSVVEKIVPVLPLVSVLGITAAVMAIIAGSADTLLTVGALVFVGVIIHNLLGLSLGYLIAKVFRLPITGRRAVSIEVGMQNSGLAAALATAHFNPVAALPAAFFSIWHNLSGPLLASIWSRRPVEDGVPAAEPEQSTSTVRE